VALASGSSEPVATDLTVPAGETFELKVGQAAVVEGGGIRVKFEEVLEDSRCPMGTQCVSVGQAMVQVSAHRGASSLGGQALVLKPDPTEESRWSVGGYMIEVLALNSYPGTSIGDPVYVGTFRTVLQGQ